MEKKANSKLFLGKRVIVKLDSAKLRNIRGGGGDDGDDQTARPKRPPQS